MKKIRAPVHDVLVISGLITFVVTMFMWVSPFAGMMSLSVLQLGSGLIIARFSARKRGDPS